MKYHQEALTKHTKKKGRKGCPLFEPTFSEPLDTRILHNIVTPLKCKNTFADRIKGLLFTDLLPIQIVRPEVSPSE